MATLHIVNRAAALASCLRLVGDGDAVLLIEDGVYAARQAPAAPGSYYALRSDLEARGLVHRVNRAFHSVSYGGFVRLVEQHCPIVTWSH